MNLTKLLHCLHKFQITWNINIYSNLSCLIDKSILLVVILQVFFERSKPAIAICEANSTASTTSKYKFNQMHSNLELTSH
jgi:hypothetical protein